MTSPIIPGPSDPLEGLDDPRERTNFYQEGFLLRELGSLENPCRPRNAAKATKERTVPDSFDPSFKGIGNPRSTFAFDRDDNLFLEAEAAYTTKKRKRRNLTSNERQYQKTIRGRDRLVTIAG